MTNPADAEIDAPSRELANLLHEGTLAGGATADDALYIAARAQRKLREEWERVNGGEESRKPDA